MNTLNLILLFLILYSSSRAQQNLVPNPSIEDTVYCPYGLRQLDAAEHWLNFGNSPDYFNACTPLGLPNSVFGFQYPHTGNAYAGAVFFAKSTIPNGPNYREPIGVELTSNLIAGQRYFVSFFAVNAEVNFGSIACDKLGVNFYTAPFDSCCPPPLSNSAKIFTDSIITDTLNWTRISGSFIADSAYQYVCISNFFNDAGTDTLATSPFPTIAYYYIDDLCVSTDSVYNETWTGLNEYRDDQVFFTVFPNPSNGELTIKSQHPIKRYVVYTLQGQVISEAERDGSSVCKIDLSGQPAGVYLLRVFSQKYAGVHKFILTK